MRLWRDYLEQYADKEGDVEGQTVVAAYSAVEVLTCFSRMLDKKDRYRDIIDQRIALFHEGSLHCDNFLDCLINATFSIYNSLNTISHQLTEGNTEAAALIRNVDEQVHQNAKSEDPLERSAAALRASFPLLGLVTIALDHDQAMIQVIRQVEQRFVRRRQGCFFGWRAFIKRAVSRRGNDADLCLIDRCRA